MAPCWAAKVLQVGHRRLYIQHISEKFLIFNDVSVIYHKKFKVIRTEKKKLNDECVFIYLNNFFYLADMLNPSNIPG